MKGNKIKTAIIISGFGSNMESLINYSLKPDSNFEVVLVISNNPNAAGLKKAENKNIKNIAINHRDFSSREEFENKIDQELKNHNCQIICLAGFMRILTKNFTDKWLGKMINIHPSLLPKYKGANAIKQAFDAGEGESGCTVHYVNEKVDDGQIIAQRSIEIKKNDSLNDVKRKILKEELEIFPLAIAEITKEMRNE
jgi:formyltetrahydrofolate-dependent phosphoribosylglycinamide formyltransferase